MSGTGRSYDVIAKLRISRDQPIPMKIYTLNREIALIQKMEQLTPARYGEMEYARSGLMFAPFAQPYNFAGRTLYHDIINLYAFFQEHIFSGKNLADDLRKKNCTRKNRPLFFIETHISSILLFITIITIVILTKIQLFRKFSLSVFLKI